MDKHQLDHIEYVTNDEGDLSYAVDPVDAQQLTVLDSMGQDPNERQAIPLKAILVILVTAVAQFNNTWYAVAPASNAYTIAAALNGNDKRIWIVQAAGIPSIVTGPIVAIIADLYGRRNAMVILSLLGAIASIVCMTAHNIDVVIVGQTLNGVAAGISGLLFAVPSEVVPTHYRSIIQGILSVFAGMGAIGALIFVSLAVDNDPVDGWRWTWRAQLICNGLMFLGYAFLYNPPPRTHSGLTRWQRFTHLDWVGYGLLTGGLAPLLMGFAWASDINYGWSDPHAYGCVVAGAVVIWEWKGTSTGFLHHAMFRQGNNFALLIFTFAVEGHMFYAINNMYSAEAVGVWFATAPALKQAASMIPMFACTMVFTPMFAIYSTLRKDLKWPVVFGILAFLVATIGLATTTAESWIRALAFNGVAGLGFSSLLMMLMTLVQLSAPPLFIGAASSLAISARFLGGTVGYGISSVIYNNIYNARMPAKVAAAVAPLGFDMRNIGALIVGLLSHDTSSVPGLTPEVLGAASAANAEASSYAYNRIWWATIPAVVLALVGIMLIKDPAYKMDWVVDAPLEKVQHVHGSGKAAEEGAIKAAEAK